MNNPLQELDNIHASQETKDKTFNYIFNQKHRKYNYRRFLIIPVMACIILLFISLSFQLSINSEPVAYVSLDINPSIELHLDKSNVIIETIAYNKDAKKILNKVNLKGENLQSAILTLLNDKKYETYLQNGLLEVSVFADDQEISTEIESTLNGLFEKHLKSDQYHCSQVDQKTHHNASSHHMTAGKYQIIETIMSYTSKYSFEELNNCSIKKLYTILYEFNQTDVPSGCQPGHNQDSHHQKHQHS